MNKNIEESSKEEVRSQTEESSMQNMIQAYEDINFNNSKSQINSKYSKAFSNQTLTKSSTKSPPSSSELPKRSRKKSCLSILSSLSDPAK